MIKEHIQIIKANQKAHTHAITHKKTMFCPECGEGLHAFEIANDYVCSGCRFVVGKNDKFCGNCGEVLEGLQTTHYFCNYSELDKEAFTNLAEALKLSKEDVK